MIESMSRSSADLRVVGGANMPVKYLRVSATWPLAVLTVKDSRLTLRLRGSVRRTGGLPLDVAPHDLSRVFPTRSVWTRGVGFTDHKGHEWYFWTRHVHHVLAVLRERGYAVTDTQQKASKVWKEAP